MPQRLVGHDRAEIGAADADIDDIADALAGMTVPFPAAQPGGKIGHLVEHGVHVGHDVASIVHEASVARRAQRDVQHRAVFGDVDLVAAEHGRDALREAAFAGKPKNSVSVSSVMRFLE